MKRLVVLLFLLCFGVDSGKDFRRRENEWRGCSLMSTEVHDYIEEIACSALSIFLKDG